MIDEKFYARIQNIARASGFSVKPPSLPYIAQMIRKELNDDAAASAILHIMRQVRQTKPDQFATPEQLLEFANGRAMERLESANARSIEEREAARIAAETAKPKVTLSEREMNLPPHVRMAIYDERMVAAIAARELEKKKKVTP